MSKRSSRKDDGSTPKPQEESQPIDANEAFRLARRQPGVATVARPATDLSTIDSIDLAISRLLRSVPDSWIDFDHDAASSTQLEALRILVRAGFVEATETWDATTERSAQSARATLIVSGEYTADDLEIALLPRFPAEWTTRSTVGGPLTLAVAVNCSSSGYHRIRLTADGVLARDDMLAERRTYPIQWARRTFPHEIRQPVRGRVEVKSCEFHERIKAKLAADSGQRTPAGAAGDAPTDGSDTPMLRLLSVYSDGIADDRIEKAAGVLQDEALSANDKLTKIDAVMPIPPTASAMRLAKMLSVTPQAIKKTDWWEGNRRGQRDERIAERRSRHRQRAAQNDLCRPKVDDE